MAGRNAGSIRKRGVLPRQSFITGPQCRQRSHNRLLQRTGSAGYNVNYSRAHVVFH